jgi:hypothetical protein
MTLPQHTQHLLSWPGHYPAQTNPINRRPTRAPTVFELLALDEIVRAIEGAWAQSWPTDPVHQHEEGGWIYMGVDSGRVTFRYKLPPGTTAEIDLNSPPLFAGYAVVATFHTHPNPDGPGPSTADLANQTTRGVPGIIRAHNGLHLYGMEARRDDWRTARSNPGYPPPGGTPPAGLPRRR